jgi:phosphotriesterase-related protein
MAMLKRGYVGSMALSHDCCAWSDVFPRIEDYHAAMPRHHYLHIHNEVVPALLEAGASQRDLDTMFVDNPRRYFEAAARHFAAR